MGTHTKKPIPNQSSHHPSNQSKPENRMPFPSQKGAPKPGSMNK